MEKLTSFRIEKKANEKVLGQINHDMRIGKIPKYINKAKSKDNVLLWGEKLNKDSYEDLLKEQNKRSKRKIQKNTERFFAGIMTFSNTMTLDYKKKPMLFQNCAKNFIQELEEQYGLQVSYAELHLDETTPHIHILFDNISKIDGKSIRRGINPQKLKDIQSLLGQCFEPMGYQRGKDKNETNAKHFNFKDYQKVKQELEEMKQEAAGYKKELELFKKFGNGEKLTDEEKEILKVIAPYMFQFMESESHKEKQKLSNKISKFMGLK
jgi:hypothetical protein